jgi:hypothetical protein
MNVNNSRKIQDDLLQLINVHKVKGIQANIFLRPTKPVASYMLKYEQFLQKTTLKTFVLISFKLLVQAHKELVLFAMNQVRYAPEFRVWKRRRRESLDHVFLSHYFGSVVKCRDDNYFGSLPHYTSDAGGRTAILMINHSNADSIKFDSEFSQSNGHLLLPRATSFPSLVRILLSQIWSSIRMLFFAMKSRGLTPNQRLMSIATISYQFHTGTLSNLVLWNNLREFIVDSSPKNLFITFEGHAYENIICKNSGEDFPALRVYAYQHAPLVMNQFGLLFFFNEVFKNVTILTSGEVTRKFLLEKYPNKIRQLHCVGTRKAQSQEVAPFTSKELVLAKSSKKHILFAPEGTNDSTNFLFDLNSYLTSLKKLRDLAFDNFIHLLNKTLYTLLDIN